MDISLAQPILIALVFGLVVQAVRMLIAGTGWGARLFFSEAWVLACLAYIILVGVIRI